MEPQIIQNLRYKLQKRIRRLSSVDQGFFIPTLQQFWAFFDSNPTYSGIAEQLSISFPALSNPDIVNEIISNGGEVGNSEEAAAALGYGVLRGIAKFNQTSDLIPISYSYGNYVKDGEKLLDFIRDIFLEPFYEYVDEKLDDQRAILSLLLRYKHRSEWFYRDRLFNLSQLEPRKAENFLALDLYSYLYDQGIDFSIEPSSGSGEIDLIGFQNTDDPLLADAKIFDAADRSKRYIRKAFNQIYTYTQQYNEPFGYLVIYKITDRDLSFLLSNQSQNIPAVTYNHKTIFLITIDIHSHTKSVSQRDPLKTISITEEELITEEESIESVNSEEDSTDTVV